MATMGNVLAVETARSRKSLLLLTISALRAGLTTEEIVTQTPEAVDVVRSPLVKALARRVEATKGEGRHGADLDVNGAGAGRVVAGSAVRVRAV